jgi:hypothetical protein
MSWAISTIPSAFWKAGQAGGLSAEGDVDTENQLVDHHDTVVVAVAHAGVHRGCGLR